MKSELCTGAGVEWETRNKTKLYSSEREGEAVQLYVIELSNFCNNYDQEIYRKTVVTQELRFDQIRWPAN